MKNRESTIAYAKRGADMGNRIFQAFLLSGERYVTSKFNRKNTFEKSYEDFHKSLSKADQERMVGYFQKQSKLSISQRTGLLGDLVKLSITDPLTIATVAPQAMTYIVSGPLVAKPMPKLAKGKGKLKLVMDSIKVVDSQDERYVWTPWKKYWYNQKDEITIATTGIDPTGEVSDNKINLAGILEGTTGGFRKNLISFSVDGKAKDELQYDAIMVFVERDGGDFNKLFTSYVEFVKKHVRIELIESGLGGLPGTSHLPDDVREELAALLKASVDSFIGFIHMLFTDKDELMGEIARTCILSDLTKKWTSSKVTKYIREHGGTWKCVFHWDYSPS